MLFKKRHIIFLLLYLSVICGSKAGNTEDTLTVLRPVTSSYSISSGDAEIADTYLSPIIYDGWNIGFQYSRMQAMKFSPRKWVMELQVNVDGGRGRNKAHNSELWQANVNLNWGMMRRWPLTSKLTLGFGGHTGIEGGAIYLKRNGNNPVAAKASWTIGIKAYATYPIKIGRLPVMLRWTGSLPISGIFFSPDYGELYYEIWLGNHSGLVHAAWPGNYFGLDNTVSADLCLGTTWLRIGYRSHVLSTKVNDITTRIITNSFLLGISTEWISLSPRKSVRPNVKIISSIY